VCIEATKTRHRENTNGELDGAESSVDTGPGCVENGSIVQSDVSSRTRRASRASCTRDKPQDTALTKHAVRMFQL